MRRRKYIVIQFYYIAIQVIEFEKELYRNTRRCIAIQANGVEGEVISQYNFIISQYNSLSCSRVISQCNELYCNISH